jgi:two-component system phosphate regulon sensor histidine kinase PhoR
MLWPALSILAIAGIGLVYWLGRARLRESERRLRTELEQAEQRHQRDLGDAYAQQEALLNSMIEGVLLLDENGRIQMANRAFAALFGAERDLRSLTILEALRQHELSELVQSLQAGQPVVTRELQLVHPERVLQVNAAALLHGDGRRQGTILVFHDLTNLKKLERTREEFVANVSHELRTPLSMIKGYTETMLDGAKDDPEVARKFLQTIDRNAERLRLLIDDLLTISALESGRLKLNFQNVSLGSLVEKVLADFQTRAAARPVRLASQVPKLSVHADPHRLEQVLCNLVDNAIKYGRANGSVTIDASPLEGGCVQVSVQDDGPGIPPEALDRLFERFYRVDKGRSREQGGTGLGLSIVKHIVQSHGGKAWATSQQGQGATFFFTIPSNESVSKPLPNP